MKMPLLLFGFLACSVFAGCGADPVKEYPSFLDRELQRLIKAHPTVTVDDHHSIDIKKTDSERTPLEATCIVKVVSGVVPDNNGTSTKCSWSLAITHGLRDNRWIETAVNGTLISVDIVFDNQESAKGKLAAIQGMKEFEGSTFDFDSLDTFFDNPVLTEHMRRDWHASRR